MKFAARVLASALLLAGGSALAHESQSHPAPKKFDGSQIEATPLGQEGDPKKVARTIRVSMNDRMRFEPENLTVRKGETVRFVVTNQGAVLHEMVLGTAQALKEHAELMTRHPGMEHEEPNMAHVKPGATGEIVWQFTQAGEFQFACLIPGHFEAGMVGKVVVK
jgi:uncharacterized cupredoxin-like copper-binding protein